MKQSQVILENVEVKFGARTLFHPVNWTIYAGSRINLAGRNGSGKSTLLKIIAGKYQGYEGQRVLVNENKLNLGYLDQSLFDQAVQLKKTPTKLSPLDFIQDLVSKKSIDWDDSQVWQIEKVLSGLGFDTKKMTGPLTELSGGWLLRVLIAASLIPEPDILLLDEPTNHLDMSSIQWFEKYLCQEYQGTLLLVTHDIDLQRKTTDSIAAFFGGRLFFQKNQSDYLSFLGTLSEQQEILERELENKRKKHQEIMSFVYQYRAKARSASRVQSKLKVAQELEGEISATENQIKMMNQNKYHLSFKFREPPKGSKFPLSVKDLCFHYHQTESDYLIENFIADFNLTDRVAIIGDNGTGKTTLLKLFDEQLTPLKGEISLGYQISKGYFGQLQLEQLISESTVIQNLEAVAEGIKYEQLRQWLGAFGFGDNDDIDKKIKVLSGGERSRLALLRLLCQPSNLILLDEPTNHLDIETKQLLKNAIKQFPGAVIYISHDRDFINATANRIVYLSDKYAPIDHLGDLESFFDKYRSQVGVSEQTLKSQVIQSTTQDSTSKNENKLSYEERKKLKNLIRNHTKKISIIEKDIDTLTEQKESAEQETLVDSFYQKKSEEQKITFDLIQQIDQTINEKTRDWERLATEKEVAEKKIELDKG